MIYICLGNIRVEILTFDESKKKLIDHLNVWPGNFQDWFIFFRIKRLTLWVHGWRNGSEQVLGEHLHHPWVHLFRNHLSIVGDIVEQFMQSQALDLLRLHVTTGIVEIENDVALVNLLHEKLFALVRRHLVEPGQLLQLPLTLVGDVEA